MLLDPRKARLALPGISFVYPEMLWLLILIGGLWGIALVTPRRLSPLRFYSSLALRSVIVAALVFAIAGAQLMLPVRQLTTVFLLDSSDSIATSARAQAETFIQEALQAMRSGDRAAIVVFGTNALVDRPPDESDRLSRITTAPIATRTNIAEAIQLGLALFPADAQKRLVLLSDGGENEGNAIVAAHMAAARGVPIEVVDIAVASSDPEVIISRLEAPTHARDGQDVTLNAIVQSTQAGTATVQLLDEGKLLVEQQVELTPGENTISFQVKAVGSGFQRYRVVVRPAHDSLEQNNEAAALIQVQGLPRVLVVSSNPDDAKALVNALKATKILPEQVTPDTMPTDLAGLSSYEAVLLVNVPARDLPVEAMAALPVYVRDLGRGLVMIGGEESFGVGGYGHTPIEEALPVYMDVRDRQERPDLALAFVIDKSGSMDSCHCASSDRRSPITGNFGVGRKLDIAKEAVAEAAALLSERDTIGIVGFDRNAEDVLPATRGAPLDQIISSMGDLQPRGSTNVRSGLIAAEEMLDGVDARIKHIILLTDGWGSGGSNIDIARHLLDKGITLTVVAAGGGSATYLEELATAGGGRFYPAERMDEVPQIFVQETITTIGNYIVEQLVEPEVIAGSPVLSGIERVPALYGYNGSTLKDSARPVLVTSDNQPLLVTWQYGLGRSAAWLSDTRVKWARDWIRWGDFPRFAGQLTSWVLPVRGGTQTTTEVTAEGSETRVQLVTGSGTPEDANSLEVTATLIANDGSRHEIHMPQTGPNTYQGQIESPEPGTYLVQVAGTSADRVLLQETASLVIPYSPEYGPEQSNPELLQRIAIAGGGKMLTSGADAFSPGPGWATRSSEIGLPLLALVLILLPIDILIRRIAVRVRNNIVHG